MDANTMVSKCNHEWVFSKELNQRYCPKCKTFYIAFIEEQNAELKRQVADWKDYAAQCNQSAHDAESHANELEAGAAAMREAFLECDQIYHDTSTSPAAAIIQMHTEMHKALSTTAGRDLLKRVDRADKLADAVLEFCGCVKPLCLDEDELIKLDNLRTALSTYKEAR